jgi:hypothetical protein
MDSPTTKVPSSAPEPPPGTQAAGSSTSREPAPIVRSDRLYQIAAVTAGLILLATAF